MSDFAVISLDDYLKPVTRASAKRSFSRWTLSPINVFRKSRKASELARPACRYEPADKAILQSLLPKLSHALERFIPKSCIHLKGRGGYREAVRVMNEVLGALKLAQHPDKTFIGRLSRGFDAFGYQFAEEKGRVGPSKISVQRFATRLVERYAQHESRESLLHYVNRWLSAQSGAGLAALDSLTSQTNKNQRNTNHERSTPLHAAMETDRYRGHGSA